MIKLSDSFVYLKRKLLFTILLALIIFPIKPIVSNSQVLYQSKVLKTETESLMSVANIDYFHESKISIQGKKESDVKVEVKGYEAVVKKEEPEEIEKDLNHDFALPDHDYKVRKEIVTTVTAYNPVPEQTDSTPCITANGTNICEEKKNVIAANWLPFGTKVQIPDYFGDKIFEVEDRMNKRYPDRVDVLMYDLEEAKQFGRRNLRVIVLD